MVLRYGMSDALGHVAYEREQSAFLQPNVPMPQARYYSEDTANKVDNAVRELIDQALARSIGILQANRALLDRSAEALLKTETLNAPEIEKLKQAIVKN
jgi:cell division protease FtsH